MSRLEHIKNALAKEFHPLEKTKILTKSLMGAAAHGDINVLKFLINEQKMSANFSSLDGKTPLMLACINGHLDAVRFLVEFGHAKVDEKNNGGTTALMFACINGHLDAVRFLVEFGHAKVDEKNNGGTTALMFACRIGRVDIVKFLVKEAHANLELQDKRECTALKIVNNSGHSNKGALIDILTNNDEISIEDNNIYDFTPLDSCSKNYNDECKQSDQYTSNVTTHGSLISEEHNKIELIGTNPDSCVCIIS